MPIFAIIFFSTFVYSCFFLIWSSFKPWSKKKHVTAYVAGGLLFFGSLLQILNDLLEGHHRDYHRDIGFLSIFMLGASFGMFIRLMLLLGTNKNR